MTDHPSFYSIMPATVRYATDINAKQQVIYTEITCLCNVNGYCTAKNKYFSERFNVTKITISRWISNLEKQNYIRIEIDKTKGNERRIYLTDKMLGINKNVNRVLTKLIIPINKTDNTYNNTSINNTSINNKNIKKGWEYDEDFKKFLEAYPSQSVKSKILCYKIFKKSIKGKPNLLDKILKSLEIQKRGRDLSQLYECFIADWQRAKNWLLEERWDYSPTTNESYYQNRSPRFQEMKKRLGSYARDEWYREKGYIANDTGKLQRDPTAI